MKRTLDDIWLIGDFSSVREEDLPRYRRRNRLLTLLVVGGGYAFDTLLLSLFCYAGVAPALAVVVFGLGGLSHIALFLALNWLGVVERAPDPNLTEWQMAYALAVQVIAMALAPKLVAFFMGIMFIIFAFGAQRLPLRRILLLWSGAAVATLIVLVSLRNVVMTFDHPGAFEAALAGVAFASLLLRTLSLDYYSTALRKRLLSHSVNLSVSVEKAEIKANVDMLTGLRNRRAIDPLLAEQLQRLHSNNIPACVAMIDIDHFKAINDRYGHLIGDQVLRRLAHGMAASVRTSDVLVRFGGEEFVLVLAGANLSQGRALTERLRTDVEGLPWESVAAGLKVTISAGITTLCADDTIEPILARADAALYRAKRSGRNCVVANLDDVSMPNVDVQ